MLRLHAVPGNTQWLDGGAMFGNVPRALWSKWCPPDDRDRIRLACRAALVDEGDRKVLLETGIGAFFEPKLKDRFGVVESHHVLLHSLSTFGLSDSDIDVVVLSHLHFDHAGGLLTEWRDGVEPELLFPNARYVVGKAAFERAQDPHPRDRASFVPGLTDLLAASGRLEIVDGAESELLGPRYSFVESYGHTPGMLHTTVTGARGSLFFCADLAPGRPWVHLPVTMGYDRYPEKLIDEKRAVFGTLMSESTWLFFTHDFEVAAARLARGEDGRFGVKDELSDFGDGLDLDATAATS